MDSLHTLIGTLTGLQRGDIRAATAATKAVDWGGGRSQMVSPIQAVVEPAPVAPAIVAAGGRLVVTGDFMSQSNFVGCYAAASAAAATVLQHSVGVTPHASPLRV